MIDCRHCLRRVCSKHFVKTDSGYRICTDCQGAGVEMDPDAKGGEGGEEEEEEDEEEEEEGGGEGGEAKGATK